MNVPRGTTDLLSPRPVQVHPLCKLNRFGRNPVGDLKYRVVYAPSRMYMVGKVWEDNHRAEYRFIPLYKAKAWILERWLSPREYCGMGPERWEIENRDPLTGLYITGPYPHQGEYEMCWDFEGNEPTHGFASRVIGMIEAGRLKSYNEHLQAQKDDVAKREKADDARTFDQIQNQMPTFHGQVISSPTVNGRSGIRQFKTRPEKFSANQLRIKGKPLPIGQRKFAAV